MADENITLEHHLEAQLAELRNELDRRAERLRIEMKEATAIAWPMISLLALLGIALIGGFWTGLTTRFDAIAGRFDATEGRLQETRSEMRAISAEFVRRGELLATKAEIDTQNKAIATKMAELGQDITIINNELIRRRAEFVEKVELAALEKRLDERNVTQDRRMDTLMPRATWEAWRPERDTMIVQVLARLDRLERTRDELKRENKAP